MRENAAVAKNHRLRAEQLRNIAAGMTQTEERKMLLDLADDYENLAVETEHGRGIRRLISNWDIWGRFRLALAGITLLTESSHLPARERAKRHRALAWGARLMAVKCTGEIRSAFITLAVDRKQLAREVDADADKESGK
jgi:hypothetical protein